MPTWHEIAYKYTPNHDHTAEAASHLTGGNTVIIPDPDGDLIPFLIRRDRLSAGPDGKIRLAECAHLYYELSDGPIRSYTLTNAVPSTAIAAALTGTRWTVGTIASGLAALVKDFSAIHLNPLEFLRLIEKEFQARLKFHVEIDGAGITAYKVDLEEIEATFSGKRFEFGHDLHDINIVVDHKDVKTALMGTALGEEVDPLTGEPLPITFKAVEWKKSKGDPADKPLNQDWVGNEESRELYGIYNPLTGEMMHRFGKHESEAESPETLLAATWLIGTRYHFRPRVSIEGRVADLERAKIVDIKTGQLVRLDHEKVRLGQITYVIARDKGLLAAVDVRVSRIERHLKRPDLTRITWGDPIPMDSDYVREIERMAAWRDKRRRMLDRGRGPATVTVAHETTSNAPYYARFIIREGQTVNEVFDQILALLPPEGGQIVFMEGEYPYDGDIEIARDNVIIKGQGEGTRFVLKAGTASSTRGITATGRAGLEISDLAMDGQWEQQNEDFKHDGVYLVNCRNSKVSGLKVYNFPDRGIRLEGCEEVEVSSNTLNDNNYNFYAKNCENLAVTGNNVRHGYARGMFFYGVNSSVVSGNISNQTIYRVGFQIDGMTFLGCSDNIVSDNVCNENSGNGMSFLSGDVRCKNNMVSGNQCNGNLLTGIAVTGSDRCTVIGNTCCDNGAQYGDGIMLGAYPESEYSHNCVVQNNICTGNAFYGIWIQVGDHNFVTNNDCQGNGDGGIADESHTTHTAPGNRT